MGKEKKFSYEKPISLDAGKVASVLGANCSYGDGAGDDCQSGETAQGNCSGVGNNPQVVYACNPDGGVADTNCVPGGTAGESCHAGTTPGW